MFYDFECMQETGIHKVNLAIVQDFEGNKHVFNSIEEILYLLNNTKSTLL